MRTMYTFFNQIQLLDFMLFQYLYTFSRFTAESWLCDMLRSVIFLPKNVNDFLRVNLDFCEFARMRFHCASGQVQRRTQGGLGG